MHRARPVAAIEWSNPGAPSQEAPQQPIEPENSLPAKPKTCVPGRFCDGCQQIPEALGQCLLCPGGLWMVPMITGRQGCIGRGDAPPPPSRAPSLCPATVPLRASTSLNGIVTDSNRPQPASATSSNRLWGSVCCVLGALWMVPMITGRGPQINPKSAPQEERCELR